MAKEKPNKILEQDVYQKGEDKILKTFPSAEKAVEYLLINLLKELRD